MSRLPYKVSTPRGPSSVSQDGAGRRMVSEDGSRWAISRNQKCAGPNRTYTIVECWTLKQRIDGKAVAVDIQRGMRLSLRLPLLPCLLDQVEQVVVQAAALLFGFGNDRLVLIHRKEPQMDGRFVAHGGEGSPEVAWCQMLNYRPNVGRCQSGTIFDPPTTSKMYHLDSKTTKAITEVFGAFELVGTPKTFEPAPGTRRCIYTVRKPSGTKCYQVIQYETGAFAKMN